MATILTAMVLLLTTWSTPQPITTSSFTTDVSLACNPATDQVFATWMDGVSGLAVSSIYSEGTGWGVVNNISSTHASTEVPAAYNGKLRNVFAVWFNPSNLPTYSSSTVSPVGWRPEASFSSLTGFAPLELAFKPDTGQMFATWPHTGEVLYSIFSNHAWGPTGTIGTGLTPEGPATVAYNPATQQMFAVWPNKIGALIPVYYSIYTNGLGWSSVSAIPSTNALAAIGMAFNSAFNLMFIAWNNHFTPTYAFYNGTSWTLLGPIDPSVSVLQGVSLIYDVGGAQLVAAWVDRASHLPTYSFLPDGAASWAPSQHFPGAATARNNVSLAYNIEDGQIFASWGDAATDNPTWTVFQSVVTVLPVTALRGVQITNRFLLQTDVANVLNWEPSLSPGVTGYTIYRNGQQIAFVNPFTTQYEDHNQLKGSATYTVVAFNDEGQTSTPVQVTIN